MTVTMISWPVLASRRPFVSIDLLATCVGSSQLKPANRLGVVSLPGHLQAYELHRPVHVCLLSPESVPPRVKRSKLKIPSVLCVGRWEVGVGGGVGWSGMGEEGWWWLWCGRGVT